MNTSEIKFTVQLDENKVPLSINWEATNPGEKSTSKSIMLAIWDSRENSTLRIDLWTKDMLVDEMKIFFHQTMLSMADTLTRATGEEKLADDLRDYCAHFADKLNLIKKD